MTVFISRDYFPATSGYATNKAYTPCVYELAIFLHRVMEYSIVGQTGFDITTTRKTLNISAISNTVPIQITTSTPHGLSDRQAVVISGADVSSANGTWVINVTGPNTFTLVGSSSNTTGTTGTVTVGFLYSYGLVIDGYGAGINFGTGFEKEVSIPSSVRIVSSGDIGKMLVLKSTKFPTKNAGCFKISGVNIGSNRYIIDYRSTENPPPENTNSIDWWLYEIENTVSNHITTFAGGNVSVSNATNTSPIQLTLAGTPAISNGFVTGQTINVSGVGGNTAANGTWTITQISSTVYSLNGSVGNGTYTVGGTAKISGYIGDGYSFNSRIILQSPHSTGWQVRIAVEPTAANLPLFSITTGFNGNNLGDFSVGDVHTHVPQYLDYDILVDNPTYTNYTTGGGLSSSTITNRMTIVAESSGQWVFVYARSTASGANGILHFGIPDNEPITTDGYNRLFCYGASINTDFGGIILKVGTANNIGFSCRNKYPQICTLSGWANLDGTSATSPLLSANAGDSPFTSTTELLPIEIWSGVATNVGLNDQFVPPFYLDQYFMGTSPILRNGRTNFGDFTLSTDNVTSRTISAATNTSPIQITTSVAHGLVTGQTVTISGVTGNTAANGTWRITVINSTTFTLDGSSGNGTYISGGTVNGCPMWLHLQNGIYLRWDGTSGLIA
jgi:hypothetical protein